MSAHTGARLPAQKRSALSLGRTPRCIAASLVTSSGASVPKRGGRRQWRPWAAGRGREDPQLASEGHEVREEM